MIPTFFAYFRERLRPAVFGPVILLLALAACWVADTTDPWTFAGAVGLMAIIVVQFRVWDDLADRIRDRVTHPDRVLVRVDPKPFKFLVGAFAIVALAIAGGMGGRVPVLALGLLDAAFALLYAWVRPHLGERVWQYPVLLSKYPAFVVVVATAVGLPASGRAVVAALLAYAAANAYEAVHSSRAAAARPHEAGPPT